MIFFSFFILYGSFSLKFHSKQSFHTSDQVKILLKLETGNWHSRALNWDWCLIQSMKKGANIQSSEAKLQPKNN